MDWLKWTIGLIGHLGIWCEAYSQIHATAWPRSSRKFSEKIVFLIIVIPIVYIATTMVSWAKLGVSPGFTELLDSSKQLTFGLPGMAYLYLCIIAGAFAIIRWFFRKLNSGTPKAVISSKRSYLDMKAELKTPLLHGAITKFLGAIPFNEILKLSKQEMTFSLNVPAEIDGLKICQISDLHFTGQLGIEYFERLVEEANAFRPDIVVITGDLLDSRDCLPWLDSTLGKLRPTCGSYYVLGNHDRRIKNEHAYRGRLEAIGLTRAAGSWRSFEFNGVKIDVAGNELPWYKGAEALPTKPDGSTGAMKILLSHSPDQLDWAKPYKFDLMFAGHTHGGQVAFPLIGPVVAPSKYGVRYASGTFQIGKMLMHVSRGISGDEPIRFGSPPELGLFTIRSANKTADKPASADIAKSKATAKS